MSIWSAVIGAASSLLGNVLNLSSNNKSRDTSVQMNRENNAFSAEQADLNRQFQADQSALQYAFNSEEAQKQRQWEEEMWNKQNEYNSPANQLRLMQSAGLNPLTFNPQLSSASSSGAGASATGTAPQGSMATSSSYSNPSMIPFGNIALESAQARLANAQAEETEERTSLSRDTHENVVKSSGIELQLLGKKVEMSDDERALLKKKVEEIDSNINKVNAEILQSEEYTRFLRLQGDEKEKYLSHFEEEFAKRMRSMDDQHRLTDAQISHLASQVRLNLANINLVNAQTGLVNEQVQGQFLQNLLNGLEYDFKNSTADLRYSAERSQLELLIDESEVGRSLSKKSMTDYGSAMQWVHMTTSAIGQIFGGNVGITKSFK